MSQIITMARTYQQRPSEIMGIKDSYTAYCFDETAYYLTQQATDEDGITDFRRIKWTDRPKQQNNQAFIDSLKR